MATLSLVLSSPVEGITSGARETLVVEVSRHSWGRFGFGGFGRRFGYRFGTGRSLKQKIRCNISTTTKGILREPRRKFCSLHWLLMAWYIKCRDIYVHIDGPVRFNLTNLQILSIRRTSEKKLFTQKRFISLAPVAPSI